MQGYTGTYRVIEGYTELSRYMPGYKGTHWAIHRSMYGKGEENETYQGPYDGGGGGDRSKFGIL